MRTAVLDHGIPCLAFALEESAHVNIWKNRLADAGLGVGPWLREVKEAILRGEPDDTMLTAKWKVGDRSLERTLALGELRGHAATVAPGVKIAYVVDAGGTPENVEKIVALARDATILFIETPFLHEDEARALDRHHLTARQAGEIAQAAGAQRVVSLHYSPRYEGRSEALVGEMETAFRRSDRRHGSP